MPRCASATPSNRPVGQRSAPAPPREGAARCCRRGVNAADGPMRQPALARLERARDRFRLSLAPESEHVVRLAWTRRTLTIGDGGSLRCSFAILSDGAGQVPRGPDSYVRWTSYGALRRTEGQLPRVYACVCKRVPRMRWLPGRLAQPVGSELEQLMP
jgi:hypothetical protein